MSTSIRSQKYKTILLSSFFPWVTMPMSWKKDTRGQQKREVRETLALDSPGKKWGSTVGGAAESISRAAQGGWDGKKTCQHGMLKVALSDPPRRAATAPTPLRSLFEVCPLMELGFLVRL